MCHPSPVLRNPADFADVSHATSLEFVVWFVPNLFAGAISVSFVGFFLGPIFPILMNHAGRILPPDCISGAIGWTGSWGAAGAAVFPFITGAISSKAGIGALPPVYVFMLGRTKTALTITLASGWLRWRVYCSLSGLACPLPVSS